MTKDEIRKLREEFRRMWTQESEEAATRAALEIIAWKYLRRDMEDTGMVTL